MKNQLTELHEQRARVEKVKKFSDAGLKIGFEAFLTLGCVTALLTTDNELQQALAGVGAVAGAFVTVNDISEELSR